ncbi:MAG TPA: sigma-54 dependent transcriptional regulator [Steroidobacteraceae bacterium]
MSRISDAAERRSDEEESSAPRKAKILVVDQDPELRRLTVARLESADYVVEGVGEAQAALDGCVVARPNLVVMDLRLQGWDGLAFLKELKSRWPQLPVIILTAHGTIPEAVQATQIGAFGFLVKPVSKDELLGQVQRATGGATLTLSEADLRATIVSRSQLMSDRLSIANQAAGCDAPVLLTGEDGTGKELLARAIHAAGARRDKPFVVVSCRDPAPRLEAELFGDNCDGALNRARGGTLLLEEIDDLPIDLQAPLAKALATDDVLPGRILGAVRAEWRLICTTSRDLKSLTDSGAFLKDLYYQINILPIEIPPLGRRREDIPLLVSHFLEQATEPGGQKKIYSPKAIELLATTDWPGNVRQLFDLVKRNVALSHGAVMSKEFVQESLDGRSPSIPTYDEAREKFARDYLSENLQRTAGNVTQAARLAKRSRTDFYKLLARYRLHPDDFKNLESGNPLDPEPDRGKDSED